MIYSLDTFTYAHSRGVSFQVFTCLNDVTILIEVSPTRAKDNTRIARNDRMDVSAVMSYSMENKYLLSINVFLCPMAKQFMNTFKDCSAMGHKKTLIVTRDHASYDILKPSAKDL